MSRCGTISLNNLIVTIVNVSERMPKLQKHLAYKYKEKEHYKHVVVVPEEAVEKLGWQHGQELEQRVDGNRLVLTPRPPLDEQTSKTRTSSRHGISSRNVKLSSQSGVRK